MWKRLIRYIRNFFIFSHGEAKGFLIMTAFLASIFLFYLVYDQMPSEGYTSFVEDRKTLDSLVVMMESDLPKEDRNGSNLPVEGEIREPTIIRFPFNPNTLSVDSLTLLGIPSWLAQRIDKYRRKGGAFRKKDDLLRIYDFPDSLYQSLKPLIMLPSNEKKEVPPSPAEPANKEEKTPMVRLDLNQADSLQLRQLKGIGPVLSSRIVRFREKLGGFVRMEQLYEVYGLDSLVVQNIRDAVYVDPDSGVQKIPLNSASQEDLAAHPYISPAQARLIFAYRTEHGPFRMINELQKIHTFDKNFIEKIAPYIRVD